MGTFLANIQVFSEAMDTSELLNKLEHEITHKLINGMYETTEDSESADRSIILQVSSDRWISIYDQKLDEQDINAMDAIGTTITRLGVPAVGSLVHDSDLLMMRLYRDGGTADTIVNNLAIFNEMVGGGRPRKRNGLPSKWAEVCAPGIEPVRLKEIWEKETVFADEALERAAEFLAIPDEAVFRGYNVDPEIQQRTAEDGMVKVLHFRSILRLTESIDMLIPEGPKLDFASWDAHAVSDVGVKSRVTCGLINKGQTFTGLDVLVWGPAIEEGLIELGAGTMIRISPHFNAREDLSSDPLQHHFEAITPGEGPRQQISGYRYPDIAFSEGFLQGLYPADAIRLGLFNEWMAQTTRAVHSFQLAFTGRGVGHSYLHLAFVPIEPAEGQLSWRLPVYIGVEPNEI
ncbi:hypothetical protein [Paenibacillus xanthanilyticus]|uniref:Uncharacterized protein n=1 Tax=Paenibacillus xanthanilyticus TaxID=1783531 RepID=A0ABV8K6S6_9BACL